MGVVRKATHPDGLLRSALRSRAALLVALGGASCGVDDRTVRVGEAANEAAPNRPGPERRDASPSEATGQSSGEPGAEPPAACSLPRAEAQVDGEGRCAVAACVGPWLDENGLAADGCEAGDVPRQGLGLWLRADAGVVEQDGRVSAWLDQSERGLAATQPVAEARPTLRGQSDGRSMLLFDGIDDALLLPPDSSPFDGASIFAVVEALPDERCSGLLHFSNGAAGDDIELGRHSGGVLHYEVGGSALSGAPGAFVTNQRLSVSVVQAGAGAEEAGMVELRIGGALDDLAVLELPAVLERRENYVGRNSYTSQLDECSVFFQGFIGELLFYSRGVDVDERDRIETYLLQKWLDPGGS